MYHTLLGGVLPAPIDGVSGEQNVYEWTFQYEGKYEIPYLTANVRMPQEVEDSDDLFLNLVEGTLMKRFYGLIELWVNMK